MPVFQQAKLGRRFGIFVAQQCENLLLLELAAGGNGRDFEKCQFWRASDGALFLNVSRQRSPAPMPCRSMNTSSLAQPWVISQRWNARARTLSLLEWERNKRGTKQPPQSIQWNEATRPWPPCQDPETGGLIGFEPSLLRSGHARRCAALWGAGI
jgi:hypothetical protein